MKQEGNRNPAGANAPLGTDSVNGACAPAGSCPCGRVSCTGCLTVNLGTFVPRMPQVSREAVERSLRPTLMRVLPEQLRQALPAANLAGKKGLAGALALCARGQEAGFGFSRIGKFKRCPRRYPIWLARGSAMPLLLSTRQTQNVAVKGSLTLVSGVPRAVRHCFVPGDPSWSFIDLDIRCCHPAVLAMLSGDEGLAQAVQSCRLHEVTGELACPDENSKRRRTAGKTLNSALIAGVTPSGVVGALAEIGVTIPSARGPQLHAEWWATFPQAAAHKARWVGVFEEVGARWERVRILSALSGRTLAYYEKSFFTTPPKASGPSSSWAATAVRSAWTAILRGIEADLMDVVLVQANRLGLGLCVPMYDGALFAVKRSEAQEKADLLEARVNALLAHVGMPTTVKVRVQETWAG